jgi:hypothetical protein
LVLVDGVLLLAVEDIEAMGQVRSRVVINLQSVQLVAIILYLGPLLQTVVDMAQVHIGVIFQIMDMLVQEALEAVQVDIATAQETEALLVLAEEVVLV